MQISSKQLTVNLNEHTGDIDGIFNHMITINYYKIHKRHVA